MKGGNIRSLKSDESARFDNKKPPKRIYDSLFKLPAKFRFTEKRNEMVKVLTKQGKQVKQEERFCFQGKSNNYIYKKLQNYISAVILGLAMLGLVILYVAQYIDLYWGHQYYLVRSRIESKFVDDGNVITVYPILFFLYKKNGSDVARPVGAEEAERFYSKTEVAAFCSSIDKVDFFATLD